ncbi:MULTISPECIES: transcriptional repressor LexA [Arenibacter]|uniref:Repressor LexA n=1 Tax=Arenibacter echinorum TaxID=440515 RepID=A0A327R3M6_9FLAO|nr:MULTISPECIES: transcriptional repressor LexA [Arenibacter]MCK0191739.1 transcriptional repressor LexA [Arenibacter sp. F20364]RAJ10343.1 repressor LexA [Arenibacter echinorum]
MYTNLSDKEVEAVKLIRNFLLHQGRTPSVRELMKGLNYKSPRSASVLFNLLEEKDILKKKSDGSFQMVDFEILEEFGARAQTVKIPLLGNVACGIPIFADENIEAEISISIEMIKKGYKYFLLRAKGDSMDKAGINNGDLLLIRQQQDAENGDRILALIDDEATVKEYNKSNGMVILKPKSNNQIHQPIILTDNFRIQGVIENVIKI